MTTMGKTLNGTDLLAVQDLRVSFKTDEGIVKAVEGVDFTVQQGQTLGIVGESGSGKSVTTKAIMKLLPKNALIARQSSIEFKRKDGDIVQVNKIRSTGRTMRQIRGGEIGLIFQEPMASFSPVYTIGNHMVEAILTHAKMSKKAARELAIDMLDRVGIANPNVRINQYPFELSGGMRQRAMIALALSTNPALLIADEPTTALDVTIQAQILELMRELQTELDMSIIFITHDLGVISQVAEKVVVMYLGQIMERGRTQDVIHNPQHPYTQGLLQAIPKLGHLHKRLIPVAGDIPSPLNRPTGCPFHTRCPQSIAGKCDVERPPAIKINDSHTVNCFLYE